MPRPGLGFKLDAAELEGGKKSYICLPSPAVHAPRDAELSRKIMKENSDKTSASDLAEVSETVELDGMTDIDVRTVLVMMNAMESLEGEQLDQLAELFSTEEVEDAEIVQEGAPLDRFVIVTDGVLQVETNDLINVGKKVQLRSVRRGEWFDELALLKSEFNSCATVRAQGKCTIAVLQRPKWLEFVGSLSEETQTNLEKHCEFKDGNWLKSAELFASMPQDRLMVLAQMARERKAPASCVLISQGEVSNDNEFYYIVEGSVEVTVTGPDGTKSVLETRGAGKCLGQTALFHKVPRAELFLVKEACSVRTISYLQFQRFLSTTTADIREQMEKLKQQDMAERLEKVPLLSSLTVHQRMQLANLFQFSSVAKDDTIFSEGDAGDTFYMILKGKVDILVNNGSAIVKLAERKEGEAFGEIALLEDAPRTATVKAAEDTLFLTLVKRNFDQFVEVVPRMKTELAVIAEERMATRLSVMSLFRDLQPDKLALLASLLKFERAAAGDVIFSEGDVGDKFYLILNGVCEVLIDGKVLVERAAGECVGEVALIEDTPRTATLRAKESCVFMTMVRKQFDEFIQLVPNKRDELKDLVSQKQIETLREKNAMFASVDQKNMQLINSFFTYEKHDAGAVLFRQGDTQHSVGGTPRHGSSGEQKFYVILSGTVTVDVDGKTLSERHAGDVVGHMALMLQAPRMATATVVKPAVLLTLRRSQFVQVLRINPEIRIALEKLLYERQAEAKKVKPEMLFRTMSAHYLQAAQPSDGAAVEAPSALKDQIYAKDAQTLHTKLANIGFGEEDIERMMYNMKIDDATKEVFLNVSDIPVPVDCL